MAKPREPRRYREPRRADPIPREAPVPRPRLAQSERPAQPTADELDSLLAVLPPHLADPLSSLPDRQDILEIVLDLGREPEARLTSRELTLSSHPVSEEDLEYVGLRIGEFGDDNRAGIARTLHRISAIRNRAGRIVGLTCRVGRAVFGTIEPLRELIEAGRSVLMVGRPGVGKTTLLREAARVLAGELKKRVIVVDTSNEIAGDGDIPHPGIGRSRRMQVPRSSLQHAVMIEAVENHMPQVIVIDEISTELEVRAARTIAERGVQLIATAHGNTLESLMLNPTLSDLVGGIHTVTLSDEEARRRGTQKSVLERKAPPTFDVVVELLGFQSMRIHEDVAGTVDALLRGQALRSEEQAGRREGRQEEQEGEAEAEATPRRALRIFPHGLSSARLERMLRFLGLPGRTVFDATEADVALTTSAQHRLQPRALRDIEALGVPLYTARSGAGSCIEEELIRIFSGEPPTEAENEEWEGGDGEEQELEGGVEAKGAGEEA